MRKIFLITILLLSFQALAKNISCPTIADIKAHSFQGWLPLYIENEELANARDVEKFQQSVVQFHFAHWKTDYLETGHCFYIGTDDIVKTIVFAHDAWRPVNNVNWSWIVTSKFAECHATEAGDCEFVL